MESLPFATTKQFRAAVRRIVPEENLGIMTYTDKPRFNNKNYKNTKMRFVKIFTGFIHPEYLADIEFVLWSQGVTANTRFDSYGQNLRGTCVIAE